LRVVALPPSRRPGYPDPLGGFPSRFASRVFTLARGSGGFRKPNSCISELRPCGREQVRDKSVGYRSNSDGVADTLFWQPLMARQAPAAGHLRCQFASYQGRLCVLGRDRAGATAKEAQRAGIEHAWRTVRAIEAESQLSRGISSTWCAICGPAADIAPQLRTLPG